MKNFWYKKNIEDPLKGIVRYLRNNGVNTECSCGHEMYIQCQYILNGSVADKDIHDLVWCYLHSKGLDINFEILMLHKIENGIHYTSLNIKLPTDEEFKKKLMG